MEEVAERYRRFADEEARGKSPLYEAFALGVVEDAACLRFLLDLPPPKRQPNLFLAAVRCVAGEPDGWPDFRRRFMEHEAEVRTLMLERATQTNEPARCAVLLPLLAQLPEPLALIEVGASGGLCLLPDRYAYDYGGQVLKPETGDPPVFRCEANEATPIPERLPEVVWRAGLDLNPLDLADPKDAAWLEALVWPGQPDRLARLRRAMAIAREARPRVVRGDLRHGLKALAAQAPRHATLVVFHTAVLSYVASPGDRRVFAETARSLGRWISNEGAGVFPEIADRAGPPPKGKMLLARDGDPVAWTDPHGASMRWIDG